MQIGFIGLGIMGSRMAANLLKGGYEVKVYNRTISKADALIKKGAKLSNSEKEVAEDVDVLITILSTPAAVREVTLGNKGFLTSMKKNSIWIDCSTVNPSFSKEMAKRTKEKGIRFIDAPVAGTKQPAEKGELIILAGGNKNDIDEVTPLFNLIGKKIIYAGENGMGTSLKMVINLMLAGAMEVFSEALTLGETLGFTKEKLFDVLIGGPVTAPFLAAKKDKIDKRNFETDFPLQWMLKDLQLIEQTAKENNLNLPAANSIKEIYSEAVKTGFGEKDFSAIYEYVKDKVN